MKWDWEMVLSAFWGGTLPVVCHFLSGRDPLLLSCWFSCCKENVTFFLMLLCVEEILIASIFSLHSLGWIRWERIANTGCYNQICCGKCCEMLGQIILENNNFQNALGKLDLIYINENNCIETGTLSKFFQKGMQMFCSLVIGFWALRLREDILRQKQLSAVVLRASPTLNVSIHLTLYPPAPGPGPLFIAGRPGWSYIRASTSF